MLCLYNAATDNIFAFTKKNPATFPFPNINNQLSAEKLPQNKSLSHFWELLDHKNPSRHLEIVST